MELANLEMEDYLEKNKKFWAACENGDYHQAKKLINTNDYDAGGGLARACSGGNIKIVKLMMKMGGKYMLHLVGFNNACAMGHYHLVKYLIKKQYDFSPDESILYACIGKNPRIVKLMILYGAKIKEIYSWDKKLYFIEHGFLKRPLQMKMKQIILKDIRKELYRYINY